MLCSLLYKQSESKRSCSSVFHGLYCKSTEECLQLSRDLRGQTNPISAEKPSCRRGGKRFPKCSRTYMQYRYIRLKRRLRAQINFKNIDRPFEMRGEQAHSIRNDKLEARLIFLQRFKEPSSPDQQKIIKCRLITSKVTLTGQSHFMHDCFDSVR